MAKRVLLVGIDESLAIELQKARLRDDVQIVDVVSTRRAALAVMRRHGVDVVLISNELPDGSALKLGSQLAALRPAPKVVLIDGAPDQAAQIKALEAGFSAYVEKSVSASATVDAVLRV